MILTGNNNGLLEKLLAQLSSEFRMKDLGSVHYFLGIQVHHHNDGLFLNQEKYATDLLTIAGMLDCAPMVTPLPLKIDKVQGQDQQFSDPSYFRRLAGKLQYPLLRDQTFSLLLISSVSECICLLSRILLCSSVFFAM